MGDALTQLETWCAPLLAKLQPAARRTLARALANDLRRSQSGRIAQQQNPDGSAYAPRKPRIRDKKGRVRRQMFARLRTTKFLRAKSDQDSAAVEFTGRVARLARVHQEGGEDRVAKGGPHVRYAKRELLGYSSGDLRMVRDHLVKHLQP